MFQRKQTKNVMDAIGKVTGAILGKGTKVSPELQQKRFNTCMQCAEYNQTLHTCKKCGCIMSAKTQYSDERCPIGKW